MWPKLVEQWSFGVDFHIVAKKNTAWNLTSTYSWYIYSHSCLVNLLIQPLHARECYVCGIGPNDPLYTVLSAHKHNEQRATSNASTSLVGHGTTDVMTTIVPPESQRCMHFDPDGDAGKRAQFIVQCPDGYKGCITQWDGKSCSEEPGDV